VEYTSGASSWRTAFRRAVRALWPRRVRDRTPGGSLGVPVSALAAGLLFTTSATTADGTSLREDRRLQLTQLIDDRRQRLADAEHRATTFRTEVEAQTDALAGTDRPIQRQRDRAASYELAAAFTAVHGPALTVELDDARIMDGNRPAGATNDDLVVHEQDVQAVVNALWAGGAEAMTIMGVRVISTSAVRCAGNTLLLHGRVYSPPFTITAIGDPARLSGALASSDGVRQFREAAADFGLGYAETIRGDVELPAFEGSGSITSAEAGE
jgi:uncharacterized protein YlxW (UPF0749 family)